MENPSFHFIIGVPALEVLQRRLYFGLQQFALFARDNKASLSFICDVVKGRIEYNLETDSKCLTYNSDVAPNENGCSKEKLVLAYAVDLHSLNISISTSSSAGGEPKDRIIRKKIFNFNEGPQKKLLSKLKDSNTTTWSLQDLSHAEVPVKHYFELTDFRPIQHRSRKMKPRHNKFIRK